MASGTPDARRRRRPKVERTNADVAAMVRRMIRALGDRAMTGGDLDLLADVHQLHDDLDRVEGDIVTALTRLPLRVFVAGHRDHAGHHAPVRPGTVPQGGRNQAPGRAGSEVPVMSAQDARTLVPDLPFAGLISKRLPGHLAR